MHGQAIQLIQIGYWLALAAWFGGVIFIAGAAPIIFRTVKENNPVLPHVLAVNLEGQHSTLLAGAIVGTLLSFLRRIETVCAAVLLLTIGSQWLLLDLSGWNLISILVRTALYIAASGLAFYDARILWPQIWKARQTFIDHADEPETANPALDEFDRLQRESMTYLSILLFLLMGIILFSGSMTIVQITVAGPKS